MLYGTSMYNKYLSKYKWEIYIAKRESRGRNLNFSEILIFSTGLHPYKNLLASSGDFAKIV
jgi:hypothetical protein